MMNRLHITIAIENFLASLSISNNPNNKNTILKTEECKNEPNAHHQKPINSI